MTPRFRDYEPPEEQETRSPKFILLWLLLVAFAVGAACLWFAVRASAHEAPAGWKYPFACCSGIDCRPVAKATVSEQPDGFHIAQNGEVVTHNDTRLRESPDGEYHLCTVAGEEHSRTICLFVPPRGM